MFKLLLTPLIAGILAFLLVYFVSPEFVSEAELVSLVAQFTLNLSNSVFDPMPSMLAEYLAGLDLLLVSLTAGIAAMASVFLLLIIWGAVYYPIKWIISFLSREKVSPPVKDLPEITPDLDLYKAEPGKKILGRGFDTAENN